MKRIVALCALTLALLFGTSSLPASALYVGPGTGCKKYYTDVTYQHAPLPYQTTRSSGYLPIDFTYQPYPVVAVYVASGDWNPAGAIWHDHNVELRNGYRVGFRWNSLSTSPIFTSQYWSNGVHYSCSWFGTAFVSNGTLISATYIYDSQPTG